jgi:hypothetical protein
VTSPLMPSAEEARNGRSIVKKISLVQIHK